MANTDKDNLAILKEVSIFLKQIIHDFIHFVNYQKFFLIVNYLKFFATLAVSDSTLAATYFFGYSFPVVYALGFLFKFQSLKKCF